MEIAKKQEEKKLFEELVLKNERIKELERNELKKG